MAKISKNQQNIDPFQLLTSDQWRFVTAMLEDKNRSKKDAADAIGVPDSTMYKWPDYVDDAIKSALSDIHEASKEYRKQQLLKAIAVKASGLDSEDETVRQKTATEFIEWELGRAKQPQEHTGKDGGDLFEGLIINIGSTDEK
jgi:hypothetical protein